jgi:hypothetical protein
MKVVRQVQIQLKSGDIMTIDVSDVLVEKVKEAFQLASDGSVTDKHLKHFLAVSMKNMLEVADGREVN